MVLVCVGDQVPEDVIVLDAEATEAVRQVRRAVDDQRESVDPDDEARAPLRGRKPTGAPNHLQPEPRPNHGAVDVGEVKRQRLTLGRPASNFDGGAAARDAKGVAGGTLQQRSVRENSATAVECEDREQLMSRPGGRVAGDELHFTQQLASVGGRRAEARICSSSGPYAICAINVRTSGFLLRIADDHERLSVLQAAADEEVVEEQELQNSPGSSPRRRAGPAATRRRSERGTPRG